MPQQRVDFYLLEGYEKDAVLLVACRLLEKAYLRGHKVFVFCNEKQQAERLDELLWTYKEDSFVPHHLQGEGPTPAPAVQIGYENEPQGFNDLLLNLADAIPPFSKRFRRIMEIVAPDDHAKDISRNHYREYRSHACELHTHDLSKT